MATKFTRTTARIPSWSLNYLINGDDSGMTDEDIDIVENWFLENGYNGYTIISPHESADGAFEEYFTSMPEFGLPCNAVDCTILQPVKSESGQAFWLALIILGLVAAVLWFTFQPVISQMLAGLPH